MKFLIAGLGSIGRRHLRNLRALGQEDVILFRTGKSSLPDDELAGLPVYYDLNEALQQKPDGVIIANPTASHLGVALPAARAGANLLIEKPLSNSTEGLAELRKSLAETQKQVLMGFHFRFHPVLRELKEMLEAGSLGPALSAAVHWGEYLPDWHPWEDYRQSYAARAELGGGVLASLCHPLDYLRFLLGEVTELSAWLGKLSSLELDVEDHADLLLGFAGGARAQLHLDYYQRPPSHRLQITCEGGLIAWDNATACATVLEPGKEPRLLCPPEGFERNSLFLAEMAHFVELCRTGLPSLCSLEDGIRNLQMISAGHQSSEQGGLRVTLREFC